MKTKFVVYKGEINFMDNQIIITDGIFKWYRYMTMFYVAIYFVGGVYVIFRYFSNHNILMIPLAAGIFGVGIIGLITTLKVNTNKTLDIRQVEKAVIKEDFSSYLNLTLYLKNSQKRKVALDYRDEDHFRKYYVRELIETLESFSINTELK
jgi:hypothetical protein